MKYTVLSMFLAFGMSAFAGPEDHISDQTCYDLEITVGQFVPTSVPREICLEKLSIDTSQNQIVVFSYFQYQLFKDLKLTSLIRKSEDYFSFKSSNLLFNTWNSGCGDGESSLLLISGLVDFTGEGDVRALQISVENEATNDTCHSQPQTTVYGYHVR